MVTKRFGARTGPWWLLLLTGLGGGWRHAALADEGHRAGDRLPAIMEASAPFLAHAPTLQAETFLAATLASAGSPAPRRRKLRLNLRPFLDEFTSALRAAGIPVDAQRDGAGAVGLSASFKVREDLPAVSFHAGERSRSVFGAFYPPQSGVSWAFVWPARPFTLRLEGGDDSEFGYFAIAGAQWHHPTRPLAAGIGVPMNLRNAEGNVGMILQFRMKFDE